MASFNFSLNIGGISELAENMNATGSAVEEAKNAAVQQIAQYLKQTIQEYAEAGHPTGTNVITGELQNSIQWESTGDGEAVVYTDSSTEYAAPVEFGHAPSGWYANVPNATDVPAYPFFENALAYVEDSGEAQSIIADVMADAVEDQDGGGGSGDTINNDIPDDIAEEADF